MSKILTNRDIDNAKEALFDLIQETAFIKFPYPRKLSSGITSEFYFDIRKITLSLYGASLVDMIMSHEILKANTTIIGDSRSQLNENTAIGGLETGSLIIIGNLMNSVYLNSKSVAGDCIKGFYIRKKPKEHGLRKVIEGDLNQNDNIILVDDVVTTSQSLKYSIRSIYDHLKGNAKIKKVITIVDRTIEHGYNSNLKNICNEFGIEYIYLFNSLQFINADYPRISN